MLLSMCASYLWKEGPLDARMFFLICLVSLSSAFSPLGMNIFALPFCFLSFPFYGYIDPIFIGDDEQAFIGYWVQALRIRFLTINISPRMPMAGTAAVAFPLFLVINTLGSILGYKLSKNR